MDIKVPKGRYVLAVSGGIDSMALLDLLAGRPGVELVIAHFNHGMRSDSAEDEKLVAQAAKKHGLKLETGYGHLGTRASEETARRARYKFLAAVQKRHRANKIITAHHQDDLIETAFINILRGTGAKGLTALQENPNVLRPLINIPKTEITDYARKKNLLWRDDLSNQDLDYLRNYIRHKLVARLMPQERKELLSHINKIAASAAERGQLIATISQNILRKGVIDRQLFTSLPHEVGNELLAYWLRNIGVRQFDKKTIERLNLAIKSAPADTKHNVRGQAHLIIGARDARFGTSVE